MHVVVERTKVVKWKTAGTEGRAAAEEKLTVERQGVVEKKVMIEEKLPVERKNIEEERTMVVKERKKTVAAVERKVMEWKAVAIKGWATAEREVVAAVEKLAVERNKVTKEKLRENKLPVERKVAMERKKMVDWKAVVKEGRKANAPLHGI